MTTGIWNQDLKHDVYYKTNKSGEYVLFKEDVKPTMKCRTLDNLQNNVTFTNKTKTVGIYGEITVESNTKWTTFVHVPEAPKPTLPDTGK